MAKKKSKKTPNRQPAPPPPSFDPRSMEEFMRDLTRLLSEGDFESEEEINQFLQQYMDAGPPPPAQPRSDLDRAQNLIYQAYDAPTKQARIKLARAALDISLDCADAYVMLAELSAQTVGEALALYEAGVKAGERALGADFEELKGNFWAFLESRPYMRARHGLTMILRQIGRVDEAAQHMDAMLELNPNDNQGIRYSYISLLLERNDSKRIESLFEQYPDDWSATWKYNRALYEFGKTGQGDTANALLLDAIDFNPHVPSYLLGKKKLRKHSNIAYYSPGDDNEALEYLSDGMRAWINTEGAIDWIKQVMATHSKSDTSS